MTFRTSVIPAIVFGVGLAVQPTLGRCEPNLSLAETRGPAAQSPSDNLDSLLGRNGLQSLLGREIKTRNDESSGRIIDVLADPDGHVRAAVVELGGFLGIGTRKIVVEWNAIRFEGSGEQRTMILDLSHDQLRHAPEYKPAGDGTVVSKRSR